MGFFSKLFSGVKSKPKQVKVIQIGEALSFFNQNIREAEHQARNQIETIKSAFPDKINQLKTSFEKLGDAKVVEERAKGSQLAKDSFVNKSLKIMENLKQEDYSNIKKLSEFMDTIIKLSPRQAIHMDFFFKQEMLELGKSMKSIKTALDDIKNLKSTGVLKQRHDIEKLLKDIRELEGSIISKKKKISDLERDKNDWQKEIKSKNEKLSLLEMEGMTDAKKDLENMKKERDNIHQKIDSAFGPAEKFLKKYLHTIETNPESCSTTNPESCNITDEQIAILKNYTELSSHTVFNNDVDLLIKDLLKQSLEYARNDPDIFDAKRAEKVEILINDINSLAKDRKHLEHLETKIRENQNEIQDIWIPKQKHRHSISKEIDDLAVNIDAIDREILDLQKDIEIKQKKVPILKEEISQLLTEATGMQIEVQE